MLDIKLLRQDLDAVVANLARRGFKLDRERWLALEAQRKELQIEVEGLRQTRNERSKSIGRAKAAGGDVESLKREVGELGDALTAAEAKRSTTSSRACRTCCTSPCRPAGIRTTTSSCGAGARRRSSASRRSITSRSARSSAS